MLSIYPDKSFRKFLKKTNSSVLLQKPHYLYPVRNLIKNYNFIFFRGNYGVCAGFQAGSRPLAFHAGLRLQRDARGIHPLRPNEGQPRVLDANGDKTSGYCGRL